MIGKGQMKWDVGTFSFWSRSKPTWLLLALLLGSNAAQAVVCTWSGAADSWDNPAQWAGCSGGNGSTPNTPGSADTAIINSGSVLLSNPESAMTLQLNGGTLDLGMFQLDVSSSFDWSSGSVGGFAANLNLLSGSTSSWTGGDKTLLASNVITIDGTVNWSAGLLHLEDSVVSVNSTGIWNWVFNGPVEYIDVTGAGTFGQVFNDGIITKSGSSTAELRTPVSLDGSGSLQITAGDLLLGGSNFFGGISVSAGSRLIYTDMPQSLALSGSLSGAGDVEFGRPADPPGCAVLINGSFTLSGAVRIQSCDVFFDNGSVSLNVLQLLGPNALLGGPAAIDVSGSFQWDGGTILGIPAETLILSSGSTSTWAGPALGQRVLQGRTLVNDGAIQQTQLGRTTVNADGQFINSASGSLELVFGGAPSELVFDTDGSPAALVDNQGTVTINAGGGHLFDVPFVNNGLFDINNGTVELQRSGTDSGVYQVDLPGRLVVNGGNRVFDPSTNLVGNADLHVDGGAAVLIQGGFNLPQLSMAGTSTVDWAQALPLVLASLAIQNNASFGIQGPLSCTSSFNAEDGDLHSLSGVQPLTIPMGSTLQLPNTIGEVMTFADIDVQIDGIANWTAGDVNLDLGSSITVGAATGAFNFTPTSLNPIHLGCAVCGVPVFNNFGLSQSSGTGTGDDVFVQSPVQFVNQGTLNVLSHTLSIHDLSQSGVAPSTNVASAGTLESLLPFQLNTGDLSGNGTVRGDVNNNGGTVRPGTSPGALSIDGNYLQMAGAALEMEIGGTIPGTQYDQLAITGTATLDGALNVLQDGPFTPMNSDIFSLLTFASSGGSLTLGANPFPAFSLFDTGTSIQFLMVGPTVCTWDGSNSSWDDAGAWIGCGTGSGTTPGTPGGSDTAIINSGTVAITGDEIVDVLQMSGGTLTGDANLDVTSAFDWSGGTLTAATVNPTITLSSAAVSSWSGGDKFLTDRLLINDGTINWSAGLLHLQDTQLTNSLGAFWNWLFNGPVEFIDRPGGLAALVLNDGQIDKSGTADGEMRNGVDFAGTGSFRVSNGTLLIGGNGNFGGSVEVLAGAQLVLVDGTQTVDMVGSVFGAGDLQIGRPSPSTPGSVLVDGSFALSGLVQINNSPLLFDNGATAIARLELVDAGAVIGGPAALSVTTSFVWNEGTVVGAPGETLTVDAGATGTWANSPSGRNLLTRTLIVNGAIQQVQPGTTSLNADGQLSITASGSLEFAFAGNSAVFVADGSPLAQIANTGTLIMNGSGFVDIVAPFNNNGLLDINNGFLSLQRAGSDGGTFQIDTPGQLTVSGHSRTWLPASDVTGTGTLRIDNAGTLDLQGGFNLRRLDIRFGSGVSWPQAGLLSIPVLALNENSTLDTMGPVSCSTVVFASSGSIRGIGGVQTLTTPVGSDFRLPTIAASTMIFDDIALQLDGPSLWRAGSVRLENGSSITIGSTGTFDFSPNTGTALDLGCLTCAAPTFINQGLVRKSGAGVGNDATINLPIAFSNQGSLVVQSQTLTIGNWTQTGAGSGTQVLAGAVLASGFQMQLTGGQLFGGGSVQADVNATMTSVIRPGSSPGLLTIGGNLNLASTARLEFELGGTMVGSQYDSLVVVGNAQLNGIVDVIQFGGFNPSQVDVFNLVQAGSTTGSLIAGANPFPSHQLVQTPTGVRFQGGALVVNSNLDPGDGVCDVAGIGDGCTLREAINAANILVGPNVIGFAIVGPGVQSIAPLSPLPVISDGLLIDGFTQPGSSPNTQSAAGGGLDGTLLIELSGQNVSGGDGLVFDLVAGGSAGVVGLVINRWDGAGVRMVSNAPGSLFVRGSYIGTSADGLSVPSPMQGNGIVAQATGNASTLIIGGSAPIERNLISGNLNHGVLIGANNVLVQGNLIGTDGSGLAPLGNGRRGVFLSGDGPAQLGMIGGDMPIQRNVISGNLEDGVGLQCAPAAPTPCFDGSAIHGNFIGVGVDGVTPIPNANGINVIAMTYGQVDVGGVIPGEGNKIEFNLGQGLLSAGFPVSGAENQEGRICIRGNFFRGHPGLAVDLGSNGRDVNDPGDPDAGFNNGQNYPEIQVVQPDTPSAGMISVQYRVDTGLTDSAFPMRIEFYVADGDEGLQFLGSDSYNPGTAGTPQVAVLTGTLLPDDVLIATATDSNCKTSEFSYYPVSVQITDDSPDPSALGDPYPVQVSLTSGPFQVRGNVIVDDGLVESCSFSLLPADAGVGSCILNSPVAAGSLLLGAQYDGTNQAFASAVDLDGEPHEVLIFPTFSSFVVTPSPSGVGDPYQVQVAMTAAVVPTGSVAVTGSGGDSCNITLVAGAGQCTMNAPLIGAQSVFADYLPDPGFAMVSIAQPHNVVTAASTVQITADTPDPSTVGAAVTVSVQVQPAVVGNIFVPSGSVTVAADTGESCLIPSLDGSGLGSCVIVFATAGPRVLGANYAGDARFQLSSSATEPHTVVPVGAESTSTAITEVSPEPSVVGQSYAVSVEVVGATGGVPCGSVLVRQLPDNSNCMINLVPGAAPATAVGSCNLVAPNALTKGLLANYTPGACLFDSSDAPLTTHQVLRASTAIAVTGQTPNPSVVGQLVSVDFALGVLTPGAGSPTGTVTVTDGIDVCQATLPSNRCQLSLKTVGMRTLSVSYGGDPDFGPSNTTATQEVVASGADLSILKRNDRCVLPGGSRISYRIEVNNAGPSAVNNARVIDALPVGLSGAIWSCQAGAGASCVANGSGNIDTLVNLASGASAVFTLSVDVQRTPETLISNSAQVQVPGGVLDPNLANNQSTDSDPIGVFCDGAEAPFSD